MLALGLQRRTTGDNIDIGRTVRALRANNEAALRLVLRKLHVRWWRSSALIMSRFLSRVGISELALKLIKEVVDTCPTCRKWARPGPHNQVSVSVPDTFN